MNTPDDDRIFKLCDTVRETGFAIHHFLKHGHLESVYENALVNRLMKQGMKVQQQVPLRVNDEDGTLLGDFVADILIEQTLLVELKACENLVPAHTAQLLGYLRACSLHHGLLVNFGAPRFQIRKYIL